MELKSSYTSQFGMPTEILREYFSQKLDLRFTPTNGQVELHPHDLSPTLIAVDLNQAIEWLHSHALPRPLENSVCAIPVLLYVPDFNTEHLLFHYDGSARSAALIRRFIGLFSDLISKSKATIISPGFTPKSKIKEEQEIIELVTQSTLEASFIKFNFSRIGDFWSYAVKHDCSLLITSKDHQNDLARVLFHFYKAEMWSERLSFYLST